MTDSLKVQIDTTAAQAALESLRDSVSKLSTSMSNISKKSDAFQNLVNALGSVNTSGISALSSSFSALAQSSGQVATAATQVTNAANNANRASQSAAAGAASWANNLRNVAAAAAQNNTAGQGFSTMMAGVAAAITRTSGGLAAATGQFGTLGVAMQSLTSNFNMLSGLKFPPGLAAGAAALGAAFIALVAVIPNLVGAIIRINNELTAFRNAMDAVRGSGAGADAFKLLQGVAARTATDFNILTKNFVGFEAAAKQMGFTTGQSVKMFEQLAGAMRILGVDGVKAERVLGAFQQMASKGKIMMEELKQQMGEALPTAIKAMANALGVSIAQMTKRLEQGQVSATILPRFTEELLKLSGGAAAVEKATKTLQAQMTALNNAWVFLADSFGQGLNFSFLDTVGAGLAQFTKALQSDGIKIFVAGIGELVGALSGALVGAFGVALQVLSPFAAGIGAVAAAIGSVIGYFTSLVSAISSISGVSAFLDGFVNSFTYLAEAGRFAADALSGVVQSVTKWWEALTKTNGETSKFGAMLRDIASALGQFTSGAGLVLGMLAGLGAAAYAANTAVSLLSGAVKALAGSQAIAAFSTAALATAKTAWAAVTGAVTLAMRGLASALMMLNGIPLVAVITSLATGFVLLYNNSEKFRASIDGLIQKFVGTSAAAQEASKGIADFAKYLESVAPASAEIGERMKSMYTTLSEQNDLLYRSSQGWTQYATAAEASTMAIGDLEKQAQSLKDGLAGIQAAQDQSKIAGKEFTLGIDTQIQSMRRQMEGMRELGMSTDSYTSRIRDLEAAKKNSALADEDAANRAARERESLQASQAAIDEKKRKLEALMAAQKLYGAGLDEIGVKEAQDLQRAGLKADQAGKIVQAYDLMTTGVGGFVRALEEEQVANERARDVAVSRYNQLKAYYDTLPQTTELEKKYAAGIKQGADAAAAATKEKSLAAAANRALILTQTEGLSAEEAQKRAYDEMTDTLKTHFANYDDFKKKLMEKQVEEAKSAASTEKLKASQGDLADATTTAATKVKEMKESVAGIGTAAAEAKTGILSFGEGAKTSAGQVVSVQESFNNFKATLDTMSVSYGKVADAATRFAEANTSLQQSLPVINPMLTALNETVTSAQPTFEAFGNSAAAVGAGFKQMAESLPVVGENIVAMQETLPPFVSAIGQLAVALDKIGQSTSAITEMTEAMVQAVPQMEDMATAINTTKTAAEQANTAFKDKFAAGVKEAAPQAAQAVDDMARSITRAMDDIIRATQAAIDKLKELAAAQSSTSGGGGGSTETGSGRYGGISGALPETQSAPIKAFANAPQFKDGTSNTNKFMKKLPGGGIPSILHPNEAVVPLPKGGAIPVQFSGGMDQSQSLAKAIYALADDIKPMMHNQPPAGLYETDKIEAATKASNVAPASGGRVNDSGQGDPPINVTLNISTPDADSFKRSEPQVKADAFRAMREAYNRSR